MASRDRLHRRFGEALREIRKKKGLTQETLAHKAGITPAYVGQLERGLKSPSLWTIHRLSQVLGVPMRDIVGATEKRI
ncbi:MAG: helix-turn-helix transcriptional regulator [Actinomycetota bacterium]